jgi:hypothetical protein
VCRTVVEIGSCEGPSKKSESVEARYPDILFSDLILANATSRKAKKPRYLFLSFGFVEPTILAQ